MIDTPISVRGLRRLYIAVGTVNTLLLGAFFLILTGRLNQGRVPIEKLDPIRQLDLQGEGGIVAVWYSSSILLLVAVAAVINYWNDRSHRAAGAERWQLFRYGWLVLAAGVLFISVDESAQLHEGLALWLVNQQGVSVSGLTDVDAMFGWLLVLAPVLLVAGVFVLGFFARWLAPTPRARALASLGVLCWVAVVGMEVVELWLASTFGHEGAAPGWFVEESLEIVGATLLLIGSLEYLIARGRAAVGSPALISSDSGRGAVFVGVAAPLVLIPLACLGVVVDVEFRGKLADVGYQGAADRMARVMETVEPKANWVIVSNNCDLNRFERRFRLTVHQRGMLIGYPDGSEPRLSPNYEAIALVLEGNSPLDELSQSLERVSLMSAELWHLQCGDATEADSAVQAWLAGRFSKIERLWLPGVPPVVVTRATPSIPLPQVELTDQPEVSAIFGKGEIELLRYQCRPDHLGDRTVLRVRLLWQALGEVEAGYHVFVHLTDGDGRLVSQQDGLPLYDRYPFDQWLPNQTVVDAYDVSVPEGFNLNEAVVLIGLYDYDTGERLPVGGSDHVRLRIRDY